MNARIDYLKVAPEAVQAVYALDTYVQKDSGLERDLIHLIKLRASIINGCSYCVDMHVKEARWDGLPEQWIALVSTWKEALIFSDRERAALAWTDAVTNIRETGAPDDVFDLVRAQFTEAEIVQMTVAIGTINTWNRLAISMRTPHPLDKAA